MAAKRKCSESELIKNAFFGTNCNSRPSDFPFQNLSISVLDLNNFRLTSKTGLFLPVFSHFHTKIMLVYGCFIVMWLSFSILEPGELFLIHFQRYVLTGSSVSTPKFRFGFL